MKTLTTRLPMTLALGGLVAVLAVVLPLEPGVRTSALLGALTSALVGGLAMVIKFRLSGQGLQGASAVGAVMLGQGLAFMLRLFALAVGAVVLKQTDVLPATGFVIAFFVASIAQQLLEARALLVTPLHSLVNS